MKLITIIYANRNRNLDRIKVSLDSLKEQNSTDFEVILVDYGSKPSIVSQLQELLKEYDFVRFFPLEVSQLLWNKSKAINYGIKYATSSYIFIADVDLIFHPDSFSLFVKLADSQKFFLFPLGYLNQKESRKLKNKIRFNDLRPYRFGLVNGMILASKEAFINVSGLDEFFHFYGAEDEDLFARLENAGYKREMNDSKYFYHNWHQSFASSEDKIITDNPRIKNIVRINQRHFLVNRERAITKSFRQTGMGKVIGKEESDLLKKPTKTIKIYNILAHVEHFLREELPSYNGEIIKVEFIEDPYFNTFKYKVKKLLGKQTQPYCSLKEVNDMVLKEILFTYRDNNYSFKINEDLKNIIFRIQL